MADRRRSYPAWVLALVVVLGVGVGWWTGHRADTTAGSPTSTTAVATATSPAGSATSAAPASRPTPDSGLATIAESRLPSQAQDTLVLIHEGGPFPYDQDGGVFQNRERILPRQASGYYHEYTVPKPGESDRGPWRLIAGAGGDVYWTADHYDSFEQVREGT